MGEQEVGSEGNGKSRGKTSGKAMDVLRKMWCTRGPHTHGVDGNQARASGVSRGRHHQRKTEDDDEEDFLGV